MTSVCRRFECCPYTSEILNIIFTFQTKESFGNCGLKLNVQFKQFMLKDVSLFFSKNVRHYTFCWVQATVRYSLVEEFCEKVYNLLNCRTIINHVVLCSIFFPTFLIRPTFLACWLSSEVLIMSCLVNWSRALAG